MILLTVESLVKHFGPEPVLAGVSLEVRPKQRIGLVGPNGTGKTTLLKILAGREQADAGAVAFHPMARVAYLEQQPSFAAGSTVWDEASAALAPLVALTREAEATAKSIAAAIDDAERARLSKHYDHLQHEVQRHDAYHLDHRIERILQGLGFRSESFRQPVEQLSGGQQNRLLLATLLLGEPDLLLLDEPSNHLDIEATQWLEDFLVDSDQAMIVVSHDRYFLDRVTTHTLELFRGTVDQYTGNFSAYWRQKAERVEVQRRTFDKQQIEIAKVEDFIRRNHYGQKHLQAEDRRKKLARIERIERPREIVAPPMGFPPVKRSGNVVLRAEQLAKAYDRPLFTDLSMQIEIGERWGILGPNGSGKTTLLRCLVGQETPSAGRVVLGANVKVAYFDQLLRSLDDDLPVIEAVRPDHKEFNESQRRDLLARFGLKGDIVFQTVGSLSGGERNRAALARLSARDANFLILDEPTNHLDLWARDALEQALAKFEGTVLLVSHDRYFLNRVTDHLLVVEPNGFRVIEGNYDAYLQLMRGLAEKRTAAASSKEADISTPAARARSASEPVKRKRRFPYRKLPDLEQDIFERESRLEELNAALVSPELHRDGNRVKQVKAEIDEVQAALRTLYEHWEEASELN